VPLGLRSFAIVAVALVCVCGSVAQGADDYLDIQAIIPITGYGAFIGKGATETMTAFEMAVNRTGGVRGRPIRFVVHDDQSNPQQAVRIANDLLAQNVPVVFGPELTANCNAIDPLLKASLAMYCMSAGFHPQAGGISFGAAMSSEDQVRVGVRYVRDRGWRKIAILASIDSTGVDSERMLDSVLAEPEYTDETVVAREHFAASDVSVNAQLTRIKASGAQLLYVGTIGTPLGTVLRGIRDVGLDVPVLAGSGNLTFAGIHQFGALLPREIYFAGTAALVPDQLPNGPIKVAAKRFQDAFRAIGVRPDISHAFLWDPATFIVGAYKRFGAQMTADQFRGYMAGYRRTALLDATTFARFHNAEWPQRVL
jgi:branched-chain amino acid transport system substrate-binding protein